MEDPPVEAPAYVGDGAAYNGRPGAGSPPLSAPLAFLAAHERLAVWTLVAVALLLRLLFLESVPNTATADELDFSGDLTNIMVGHGPGLFGLDWTPEPALSIYLMAGSWKLFGMTLFAERLVSAVFSAIAVIPFYALARRVVSAPAAYLAALLFVAARWYLLFSRSAWNNAHVVLYMLLGAWALTLALERGKMRYWIGFGVSLALLLYGYFSGRAVVIAFMAYLLIVLWRRVRGTEPGGWRPVVVGEIVATAVGAVLFAPELPTIASNYALFSQRTASVYIFNQPLPPGQSRLGVLVGLAWDTVRSFVLMDGSFQGGTQGRYKAPGDGWLDPLSTLLYLAGLVLSVLTIQRLKACALWWCLLLIPLGITQLLTSGTPDGARGLPAVAPMYFFAALVIEQLLRLKWSRDRWLQRGAVTVAALIVTFNVWTYVAWVDSPGAQQVRQPAVPVDGYYIWRDYQLARHRANLPYMTVGQYNTLPPSVIAAQIFGAPPAGVTTP